MKLRVSVRERERERERGTYAEVRMGNTKVKKSERK